MDNEKMLGKFYICEAPKNAKYVKAINTIRKYEDERTFPMNEVVIADQNINIAAIEKEDMGGLNVTNYESVLRWLLRGDTLCDVTIPEDGKIYETISFATNHGTFRADKIILSNPRIIDDKLALELYKISDLPWKSYIQILAYLAAQNFSKTCNEIYKDKINKENAKEALDIYDNYLEKRSNPMPYLYLEILDKIKETIMIEKLDIYNRKKIKTGKIIERKEGVKLSKEEYILAVQCWIINGKGEILLTQRKLGKKYGGMWEPTGGLVISGENSIQGIKRELQEEIGLNVSDNELFLIKEKIEEEENCNSFRDVYIIKKDIDLNELHFNDGEVINAKYVTIKELSHIIEQGESFEWLRYFIDLYTTIK